MESHIFVCERVHANINGYVYIVCVCVCVQVYLKVGYRLHGMVWSTWLGNWMSVCRRDSASIEISKTTIMALASPSLPLPPSLLPSGQVQSTQYYTAKQLGNTMMAFSIARWQQVKLSLIPTDLLLQYIHTHEYTMLCESIDIDSLAMLLQYYLLNKRAQCIQHTCIHLYTMGQSNLLKTNHPWSTLSLLFSHAPP